MKLFEPVRIGGMELRNRLVMSPMTTGYAGEDQLPSPKLIEYLATRAAGGVGLITLEACVVDARHREVPRSMHFDSDDVIAPHRVLVDAVHRHGARIQPQLVHPGPDALSPLIEGIPSIGPSVISSYLTGAPSRAVDAGELPAIAAQFATAVRRIREAGYDGVELHAAHGYMLLGSFLSPWRNKRGDEYGARTREGRLRFLLEVVAAIRRQVGRDFPLTLRVSGYERVPGGRTIDDTARIAPILAAAGVDAFHVSGGVIDRLTTMIITGAQWGDAHNLAGARAVRNVAGVPVIAVGRIHTAGAAEEILQRGDADLIAMGRPLLADPELPAKSRGGSARVRLCISCENCVDSMERSTMNCAVNALCGREGEIKLGPAVTARDVVVIGGGPGGLEAARLAALRGHRVTLFERERFLGGAMLLAATVHPENQPFLDFLLGEVSRLPIRVHTGHEVCADAVAAQRPDAVIVATGGRLAVPRIPGDDQPHVVSGPWLRHFVSGALTAEDRTRLAPWQRWTLVPGARHLARFATPGRLRALTRAWMPLGRRVVIIGADLAAVELAEFLAARRRVVTLVESGDRVAPEVGAKRRAEHMDRLDRLGVAVHTGLVCERVAAAAVVVRPEPGAPREIAADTVIIAGEVGADTRLFDAIRAGVPNTHAVGDCTGLGLFRKATEDAARAVATLN